MPADRLAGNTTSLLLQSAWFSSEFEVIEVMNNRFFPEKQIRNARVVRPVSGRVFIWLAVVAVVGSLISCGFMISARQHFESIAAGYETESLKQQRAVLEEQVHKLELDLAQVTSPIELERRARQLGMDRPGVNPGKIRLPSSEKAAR
jgi:hypothetical protein